MYFELLIALASTHYLHNQISFIKIRLGRFFTLLHVLWWMERKVREIWFSDLVHDSSNIVWKNGDWGYMAAIPKKPCTTVAMLLKNHKNTVWKAPEVNTSSASFRSHAGLTLLALTSLTWDIFPSIALKTHLVYLPSPNLTLTCGLTLWLNLRPASSTQMSQMIWTPGWCWLLRTYPTLLPGAPWVWELPAMPGARKLCGCMSEYVTIREDQAGLPGV